MHANAKPEIMPMLAPSLNVIRFASSTKADIIFLDAQPSLGLLLFPAVTPVPSMVEAIGQLQNTFTHSFVIVYGNLSDDKLTSLQLALPCGSMRFYSTPTVQAGRFQLNRVCAALSLCLSLFMCHFIKCLCVLGCIYFKYTCCCLISQRPK